MKPSGRPTPELLCSPTLSIIALLLLKIRYRSSNPVVYYDQPPSYLRGISRLFGISWPTIARLLSRFFKVSIQRIPDGREVSGYAAIHLKATEETAAVVFDLMLRDGPQNVRPSIFIGSEEMRAYWCKHLSSFRLFPYLLAILVCFEYAGRPASFLVLWDYGFKQKWQPILAVRLPEINLKFMSLPQLNVFFLFLAGKFRAFLQIVALLLKKLVSSGLSNGPAVKASYKVITELITPNKLSRTPFDADYILSHPNLQPDEVLFFVTPRQLKYIRQDGFDLKQVKSIMGSKGYHLVALSELPLRPASLAEAINQFVGIICQTIKCRANWEHRAAVELWQDYLTYAGLFENFKAKSLWFPTFANGRTGVRREDALLTSLCRKAGVKSVGGQSRTIYASMSDYNFDCFDLYLAWGSAWRSFNPAMNIFIKEIKKVGCLYLDQLIPEVRKFENNGHTEQAAPKSLLVSIFPSDIDDRLHYTTEYSTNFLKSCLLLADENPDCQFVIKFKDAAQITIFENKPWFCEKLRKSETNVKVADLERNQYQRLLALSDVVLAMAFTTPGTEGLLLGKRAIYYSELGGGGQVYRRFPYLVAHNPSELHTLFAMAKTDYLLYAGQYAKHMDSLDPYRDGRALSLIMKALLG